MNRLLYLLIGAALCAVPINSAFAQGNEGSATWSATVTKEAPEDGVVEVVFEAATSPHWHLYDLGPYPIEGLATSFDFSASQGIELVGEPYEIGEAVHKTDPVFGFETGYFETVGRFGQRVRAKERGAVLAGEVEYQICRDGVGCIRGVWDVKVQISEGDAVDAVKGSSEATSTPTSKPNSMWGMILQAMLWGLAALLTPCVFPMIPMTVSFFMKNPGSRSKALIFGVLIVAIFTLPIAAMILTARFAGGEAVTADVFNWLSTHWFPNTLFFITFMIFAASLLGAFEMQMPSGLINKSDRGADKGGFIGIFYLALTLVLVSFSCTGPIVGSALIASTKGEFWAPIMTMLVFSTVFALPFTLFAFFPRVMERLPRSGGWLNSVKVVLGLVEIALGLKFLSVADQTYHWGVLDREVYLAIWIVVFSILGLYLLGKIRFRHDSPVETVGVGRLFGAIGVFAFVVYLVPGMWGAPLSAISGYLPPRSTQEFIVGQGVSSGTTPTPADSGVVKYGDVLKLPHGMSGYFDLEQGMEAARRLQKPVFLDFTGHGCVNCREMEERVWVDGEVQRILRENYVVIALYGDDRTKLPENEWITTPAGKTLKTLGRKNSYIVNSRYGVSAQPAYLLLDNEGKLMVPVYGYNLDIQQYIAFLTSGISAYEKSRT